MEVLNPSSALLSNYEVLTLLRELESDHINRTRIALRVKKEEEAAGGTSSIVPGAKHPAMVETSENLRTIQAIQYLSAPHQPTSMQTPESITKLTKALAKYDLTKAEKLQIINLAPTQPVELYVIIEELEDRLGESMNEILTLVGSSLSESPLASQTPPDTLALPTSRVKANEFDDDDPLHYPDMDADGDIDMEEHFDDTGEGAGIEGDLDVEED
ncbi:hypothetical protein D9758_012218 [Tetrapyrgos nigripes]|uniref:DNA-directed RNA polymerase III subunit RPC9 n=1 Tax=Tetrapyrgos nigripes TaxID=182062 RepID=A0A8H5FIV4_9AGAR|nr:hypothetical protein D9758_012218 [Tetrapyrgos nigripes]